MLHGIRELVDWVARCVPSDLVDATALRCLRAIPGGARAFSWAGLECRLTDGDGRVDFMACIDASLGGASAAVADASLPPVVARWADTGHELVGRYPYLWLEYDLPADGVGEPLVFLKLGPHLHCPTAADVAEAVREIAGHDIVTTRLERAVEALPGGGRVVHATWLGPRSSPTPRVIVSLPRKCIVPWLGACGWDGDARDVEALADAACRWSSHATLAVNVAEEPDSFAGLEVSLPTSATTDIRWRRLFEWMREGGLGDHARLASIQRWQDDTCEGERRELQIKLTSRRGRLEAKAYLAFRLTRR